MAAGLPNVRDGLRETQRGLEPVPCKVLDFWWLRLGVPLVGLSLESEFMVHSFCARPAVSANRYNVRAVASEVQ